ncbi:MAG: SurA N-terminal domain-containing protein, partial [Candidatus Tectimicrobiota bacterium]
MQTWSVRLWGIVGGALILLGFHGHSELAWTQSASLVDGVAAIVNDDIITVNDVREAMGPERENLAQQMSGFALEERLKALFKLTLNGLVDAQLQLARARQLNLRVTEEDVMQQIDGLKKQNQLADEQFLQLLKARGLTLETYKKQVQEGILVAKVVNAEVRSR